MNVVQQAKDAEGYTLGNVCTDKQFDIDAKDRPTLSEIAEHPLITNLAKFDTANEKHLTSSSCTLNSTDANASNERTQVCFRLI
jgi:hypothetical protein